MRVLVVESDKHAADGAIVDLQAAGHHVVRCHEADLPAFPCNALCDQGTCPLETTESVDVVLDYRFHPHPRPTAFEDGVSCALRRHVPLVVAGRSALNPFDRWTTAIVDDGNVVDACEKASAMPLDRVAEPARREVRERLDPHIAEWADVVVHRRGGQLDATIQLPRAASDMADELAVAVAGVLRAQDRFVSRINVAVQRVDVNA
jgi:hypothetical protein